jgi:hypothetical protein
MGRRAAKDIVAPAAGKFQEDILCAAGQQASIFKRACSQTLPVHPSGQNRHIDNMFHDRPPP